MANQLTYDLNLRLDKAERELDKLVNKSRKSGNNAGSQMGSSFKQAFTAIISTISFAAVMNQANQAIKEFDKLRKSEIQLEGAIKSVNKRLKEGSKINYNEVNAAVDRLFEQFEGTVNKTTLATGFSDFFRAGITDINEISKALQGYADIAATGKSDFISLDAAVAQLTEQFRSERAALGETAGLTDEYISQILPRGLEMLQKEGKLRGKKVDDLTKEERAMAKLKGLTENFDIVQGGFNNQLDSGILAQEKFNAQLVVLRQEIGRVLKPMQILVYDRLTPLVDKFIEFTKENPEAVRQLTLLAGGAAVLAAVFSAAQFLGVFSILGSFVGLLGSAGGLLTVFGSFGAVFATIASGAQAVIVGVSSMVGALASGVFSGVLALFGNLFLILTNLGPVLSIVGTAIAGVVTSIMGFIGTGFAAFLGVLLNPMASLGALFVFLKTAVVSLVTGGISLLISGITTLFTVGIPALIGAAGALLATLAPFLLVIGAIVAVGMLLYVAFQDIQGTMELFAPAMEKARVIGDQLKEMFFRLVDYAKAEFAPIMERIKNELLPAVAEAFNGLMIVIGFLIPFLGPIFKGVISIIGTAVNMVITIFSGLVKTFKGVFQIIKGLFIGDMELIKEGFVNIWEGIGGIISGIFKGVINGLIDVVNTGIGLINTAIDKVPDQAFTAFGTTKENAKIPTIQKLARGTDFVVPKGAGMDQVPFSAMLNPGERVIVQPQTSTAVDNSVSSQTTNYNNYGDNNSTGFLPTSLIYA